MKKIILIFGLLLLGWQVNAQTYCTPAVLANGCSVGDHIDDFIIPTAGFNHLGTGCSANNYGDFTSDVNLEIDLQQDVSYSFTINHGFGGQFVQIWIDFDQNNTFDATEEIFASAGGGNPTNGSFIIPSSVSLGATRMRVVTIWNSLPGDPCTPSGSYGETHDYTINILPPPTCPAPTNLALASVQNQSADFSWDDVANASNGYIWEVYSAGDDPSVDSPVANGTFPVGTTSGQATGLNASSDYDMYLIADCGTTDGLSTPVGPLSFSTLCDVITAPFSEDFNASASIPNCWEQGGSNAEDWLFGPGETYTNIPAGTESPSGGNNAHIDDSTPDNLGTTLVSPLVDVSGLTTPALFFYWTSGDLGIYLPVDFTVDVWDGAAWNNVFTRTSASETTTNGFEEVIIDLSTLTITGPIQVRFVVDEVEPGDFQDDIAIDDVSIDEAPTCFKPTNLSIVDVFSNSLELSWDPVAGASAGYIWEVYNAGDDPEVDTPVSTGSFLTGDTQGIADGLTPETSYDFYLASDCGTSNGFSEFTNPLSFTTTVLCSLPSAFDVTNVLPNSVQLNWSTIPNAENGYDWAVFDAGDDPSSATPIASGTAASGETSVVATGLIENSDYEAYITTNCGTDGQSDQSPALAFSTPCLPVVAPYAEDFNAAASIPACWSQGDANAENWLFGTGETYTNIPAGTESPSGGNNAHIDDSTPDNLGTTLVSPLVDVSGLTTPALSFYWTSGDLGIYLPVDFTVDVWDGAAWNNVFTRTSASGTITNGFEEVIVDLSTLTITGPIQARFVVDEVEAGDFQDDLAIDDVSFDEAPTCLVPLGLTATNVSLDGIDISWSAISNATSGYLWSVFVEGDDPLVDTPVLTGSVAAGVTSTTITGLNSSTAYEVYIQSDCGATDGLSEFSGSVSFQTLCDVFSTPFFENFESFDVLTDWTEQECFIENSQDSFRWDVEVETDGGSTGTGPFEAFSGSNYLFTEATGAAANDEAVLISPVIDLSNLSNPELSFYIHMYGGDMGDFAVDIDDGSGYVNDIFTLSGQQQTSDDEAWQLQTLDLSAYAGSLINIRFRGIRGPGFESDIAIDDIRIDEPLTCEVPENLSVVNLTESTVELSWDTVAEATNGYIVEVYNQGDNPSSDAPVVSETVVSGTTTITLIGLSSNTSYEAYVKSDCGANGESFESQPAAFNTLCSPLSAPFTEDFDGSTWVSGTGFGNAGDAIDNCWSRNPGNSSFYFWGTRNGETGSGNTGPSTDFSGTGNYVYAEGSNGNLGDEAIISTPLIDLSSLNSPIIQFYYHMFGDDIGTLYVDVNDGSGFNNEFSISGEQQSSSDDPWVEQTIDISSYSGSNIQVRFRAERGDGFTSDLSIDEVSVIEAPTCLKPLSVTLTNIFSESAEFTWDPVTNATAGYNWEVYNADDDPNIDSPVTSGSVPAGTTQALVDGLNADTAYQFYVISNCGATDGLSELSVPVNFTTTCAVFAAPYTEDFDNSNWVSGTGFGNDNDAIDGCWSRTPDGTNGNYFWGTRSGETGSGNTGPTDDFTGGGKYVFTEASNGLENDEAVLESPLIDATTLNLPQIRFYYHMFGDDMGTLHVDVNDGSGYTLDVFTISGEQQASGDEDWALAVVNLPNFTTSTVKVRFRGERGNGINSDMAIDQFSFVEAPSCPQLSNLTSSNVTDTSVEVSWDAALPTQDTFDIEVVPSGTAPTGVPTIEDITSNPYTITGLSSETDYDVYVRADCGGGDESFWIGPLSFTTAITPITVIVNNPPINNTYCYDNSEYKEFLFVSSDGTTPVEIDFFDGSIEDDPDSQDRCRIFNGFDTNAPLLYDTDVDGVDMTGVQLIADSGAAYILLESDIFGSCQGGITPLDELDFDVFAGTFSNDQFSEQNFSFYPNPVKSELNINSAYPVSSIQVFSITGQQVYHRNPDETAPSIVLDNLSSGTYLMKVQIGESTKVFKIIKE